ncbi:MAG: hypothetical protein PHW63_01220 [Alphaproteobacteria bacterium]|nr:hypothetical protein [Alphaproteobacteria bacterium]
MIKKLPKGGVINDHRAMLFCPSKTAHIIGSIREADESHHVIIRARIIVAAPVMRESTFPEFIDPFINAIDKMVWQEPNP